jgi:hypothetical protein
VTAVGAMLSTRVVATPTALAAFTRTILVGLTVTFPAPTPRAGLCWRLGWGWRGC